MRGSWDPQSTRILKSTHILENNTTLYPPTLYKAIDIVVTPISSLSLRTSSSITTIKTTTIISLSLAQLFLQIWQKNLLLHQQKASTI